MGILAKWGESTYFFNVSYYVMHLFFDVCVCVFFSFCYGVFVVEVFSFFVIII